MITVIHKKVDSANAGTNPQVIARMKSGWAVMGDIQVLPGYCLLLPDPVVSHLNDFNGKERAQFLEDMACLGDAVLNATQALRINYEMLGNLEPALHAHLFPRYTWEKEPLKTSPIWMYDWQSCPKYSPNEHKNMQNSIKNHLSDIYQF